MSDAPGPAPSPPASPAPAESTTPIEGDILATLGLSDTTNAGAPLPTDAPAGPPAAEPGEAVGSAPASPEPSPAGAPAPAPAPPPPAPTEGSPPAPAAPAPSEPPAAAPPADNEAALREASLIARLDAATRTLEQLRANPPGTPAPAGPPAAPSPEGQPAEQPFRYSLTLPEKVQQALMSDDPKENIGAINAIVNDLGTIVHNTVLTQVRGEVRAAFQTLIGMADASTANSTQEQSREAARENYFKAFPTHKNELIEPIIRQQAIALSAEHPGLDFNEQYINALGARVNTALEQLGVKPAEPTGDGQPAPSGGQPPAKPAAHLPTGPRGADIARTSGNLGEDIMGTLDPFSG